MKRHKEKRNKMRYAYIGSLKQDGRITLLGGSQEKKHSNSFNRQENENVHRLRNTNVSISAQ